MAKQRLRMLEPRLAGADLRVAKPAPKAPDNFYLSTAWRALMRRLITERGRRCQACPRTGCRIFGDHIVELKDGGAELDPDNVVLLCGSCHTTKTAAARAARMAEAAPPIT